MHANTHDTTLKIWFPSLNGRTPIAVYGTMHRRTRAILRAPFPLTGPAAISPPIDADSDAELCQKVHTISVSRRPDRAALSHVAGRRTPAQRAGRIRSKCLWVELPQSVSVLLTSLLGKRYVRKELVPFFVVQLRLGAAQPGHSDVEHRPVIRKVISVARRRLAELRNPLAPVEWKV